MQFFSFTFGLLQVSYHCAIARYSKASFLPSFFNAFVPSSPKKAAAAWGLPNMTSTEFWDLLTPSPSLSAAFLDPLPLLCERHIWIPPEKEMRHSRDRRTAAAIGGVVFSAVAAVVAVVMTWAAKEGEICARNRLQHLAPMPPPPTTTTSVKMAQKEFRGRFGRKWSEYAYMIARRGSRAIFDFCPTLADRLFALTQKKLSVITLRRKIRSPLLLTEYRVLSLHALVPPNSGLSFVN